MSDLGFSEWGQKGRYGGHPATTECRMKNVIVSYDPRHGWGPYNGPLMKKHNPPVWFGVGKVVKERVAEEVRMRMWSVDFTILRWLHGEFEPYEPGAPRGIWNTYEGPV